MKITTISSLFPPVIKGGAEVSAYNLAKGLFNRGHHASVITTKPDQKEVTEIDENLAIHRVVMPRPYFPVPSLDHSVIDKIKWHFNDTFNPQNCRIIGKLLDELCPDFAIIHVMQGIGFNTLLELAKRDIPCLAIFHDLSYVCYKTNMFSAGKNCSNQCLDCYITGLFKSKYLLKIPRIGFCSPSHANLERMKKFMPINEYPSRVILNPNKYPISKKKFNSEYRFRFVYVGQISKAKGVDFLLNALKSIESKEFIVTIIGAGPELNDLKRIYAECAWAKFTGHITMEEVADHIIDADLLCVPSIWHDNSPGVVVQAFQSGLPVMASDVGGISELVFDGINGQLLPAGDMFAWCSALRDVIHDRGLAARWRTAVKKMSGVFQPENSINAYEDFINLIISNEFRQ